MPESAGHEAQDDKNERHGYRCLSISVQVGVDVLVNYFSRPESNVQIVQSRELPINEIVVAKS